MQNESGQHFIFELMASATRSILTDLLLNLTLYRFVEKHFEPRALN